MFVAVMIRNVNSVILHLLIKGCGCVFPAAMHGIFNLTLSNTGLPSPAFVPYTSWLPILMSLISMH